MTAAAARIRDAILRRVLDGPAVSPPASRRAAFDNRDLPEATRALVDTVTRHAWLVRDDHVRQALSSGASEDEIFELVVCAALGQSSRQHTAAMAALDLATREASASDDDDPQHERRSA